MKLKEQKQHQRSPLLEGRNAGSQYAPTTSENAPRTKIQQVLEVLYQLVYDSHSKLLETRNQTSDTDRLERSQTSCIEKLSSSYPPSILKKKRMVRSSEKRNYDDDDDEDYNGPKFSYRGRSANKMPAEETNFLYSIQENSCENLHKPSLIPSSASTSIDSATIVSDPPFPLRQQPCRNAKRFLYGLSCVESLMLSEKEEIDEESEKIEVNVVDLNTLEDNGSVANSGEAEDIVLEPNRNMLFSSQLKGKVKIPLEETNENELNSHTEFLLNAFDTTYKERLVSYPDMECLDTIQVQRENIAFSNLGQKKLLLESFWYSESQKNSEECHLPLHLPTEDCPSDMIAAYRNEEDFRRTSVDNQVSYLEHLCGGYSMEENLPVSLPMDISSNSLILAPDRLSSASLSLASGNEVALQKDCSWSVAHFISPEESFFFQENSDGSIIGMAPECSNSGSQTLGQFSDSHTADINHSSIPPDVRNGNKFNHSFSMADNLQSRECDYHLNDCGELFIPTEDEDWLKNVFVL